MQLDRTSIVIAQRSADELLDLSLAVVRAYWRKLLPLAFLGAIPFAAMNFIFMLPVTDYGQLEIASSDYTTAEDFRLRYLWMLFCLVFVQAPLAMSGVTYFLGQAVFTEEPTLRQVGKVFGKRWFPILWILGIFRGGLLSLVFAAWLFANPATYTAWGTILYGVLAALAFYFVRSFRPFAPEILMLEQCPLWRTSKQISKEQTYSRRSARIHSGSGDLISIQMLISFISLVFIAAMCAASLFVNGALMGVWRWGWWMDMIFFPAILWMMALWDTVIRFLLYLNTRIRLEGWEIYLRLNAELNRLMEGKP